MGDENSPPPQEQPAILVDQLGSSEVGKLRAEAESLRTDLARSSEAREVAETRLRQLDEQREMDWGEFTQVGTVGRYRTVRYLRYRYHLCEQFFASA